MACFHPLAAFQTESGDVVFAERGKIARSLELPCGQCVGCRLERSRQWAVRCMHESNMHDRNAFVTLTYSDDNVPNDYSLNYRHFQLFMKRLRKAEGPLRFYMCGEYGELTSRPHFHACLFGVDFRDRYFWRTSGSGAKIYRSALLERLWPMGHCELGEVTFESAAYVARYIMKKVTGPLSRDHYRIVDGDTGEIYDRVPEFTRMSLKPGIGATWYAKYSREVFPLDRVVVRGVECTPPRYYKSLLDRDPSDISDYVEYRRYLKRREFNQYNTDERLATKEVVLSAKLKSLRRSSV